MSGEMGAKPKKRIGCIVFASFVFALWITVACLLWLWSMSLPDPDPNQEQEKPTFFELMPRAEGS